MESVRVLSCRLCVLCASCGSSQYCVLHNLQFLNAGPDARGDHMEEA